MRVNAKINYREAETNNIQEVEDVFVFNDLDRDTWAQRLGFIKGWLNHLAVGDFSVKRINEHIADAHYTITINGRMKHQNATADELDRIIWATAI